MPSGVFMRPRARPALAAISSQQIFREVRTEDELRAAVFSSDSNSSNVFEGVTGRRIVITAPISIKSPITITADGTAIESNGKLPIFPYSDYLPCIFDVTAFNVTLNGLLFSNPRNVASPTFVVKLGTLNTINNCTIGTGETGVQVGSNSFVVNNQFFNVINYSIRIAGSKNIITSNIITGDVDCLASSDGFNVISSNTINGASINTSLTVFGRNTIIGNAQSGTITSTATDAVTSNT